MIKLVYVIVSILIIGLIINQLIKCFSPKIIEGATGSKDESDACGKDPVLLAKTNQAQITAMKEQVQSIKQLGDKWTTVEAKTNRNTEVLNELQKKLSKQVNDSVPDDKTQAELAKTGPAVNST